ncbi:MAG: hypothetical protein PHS14_13690 [Elusimicrobia bacterium]|nr:hypothetical protein [Elusimicrobiota bacterium]
MEKSEMKTVWERIEDGQREVGVLLIAFAPLDVALNRHSPGNFNYLLLFLGLGAFLFVGALIQERRRGKYKPSVGLLIFLVLGVSLMVVAFNRGLGD